MEKALQRLGYQCTTLEIENFATYVYSITTTVDENQREL